MSLEGASPYLLLVLLGFLPTEVWRVLGVLLARGITPDSELLVWVRAVATTLLAGVVAKLLYAPSGALAGVPLWVRIGALLAGLAAFALTRRSVILGVLTGEAVLVAAGLLMR
jgi:hypothetical protein